MQANIPVLIIGAGPTGLMAAAQLQRFGIEYRIIEQRDGTTPYSKALGVQARTMEIYQQMGIADKAVPMGVPVEDLEIMVKGQYVQTMPLAKAGNDYTAFPYLFILEQSKNEELMYEYIQNRGGKVEWNTEMTSFETHADYTKVDIKKEDGSTETIHADWVIAADGGRSPIRHYLNIPFEGDTYKNVFYVVDTDVDWDRPHQKVHMNLADNNFTAFFPIIDEKGKRFRLVGILPESYYDQEDITFEDIKKNIEEIQKLPITLGKTHWFSVYRVHHRCIERFKEGRVFFAGDAAHVHSPAGGQGMNTGIQDAYNLAWKLALVVKGKAKTTLLDSYNEERLPVAHKLVNTTDSAFSRMIKKGTLINWLRTNVMPHIMSKIMGISAIQKRVFRVVSQTGIRYRNSSITVNNMALSKNATRAGERLPYVQVYNEVTEQKESIYDLLGENEFHAIVWLSNQDKIANEDAIKIANQIADKCGTSFQTHILHDITENIAAFEQLGLQQSAVYIVRPDNYIGYIGKVDDQEGLQEYLDLIFK